MRWVDQAVTRPFRCAVLPYVGNGTGHMFLDTGQDLDLEHVYISDAACGEMARLLGWVDPGPLQAELSRALARVEELEEENSRLQQTVDNVDGLVKAGMVVRKMPGRKAKNQEKEKVA